MSDTTTWTVSIDTSNDSNTAQLEVSSNGGAPGQIWIKGVAYSPCPINGSNAFAPAIGDWFWDTYSPGAGCTITGWTALWQRDLPNLRAMGVNVVRVYSMLSRQLDTDGTFPDPWNSGQLFTHTSFLDMCWNGGVDPIYVLVGVPLPQAMFWQDSYQSAPQSELDFWNNVLAETAAQVGSHPAVLGIIIQNELDSAVVTYPNSDDSNLSSVNFWWSQVQKLGQVARTAAPGKLIGMAVHDDPNIPGLAAPWMEQITSLDFWGVNTYQTETFQPVFDAVPGIGPGYQGLTGQALKPVILTEFGIPATGHEDPDDPATIFADSTTEGNAAAVLDRMLPQVYGAPPPSPLPAYQSGLSLGVCYFEYCDEWWNQGGSPDIYTWYGGASNPGFPNGYWDQDGFGIYSVARGQGLSNDAPIWSQSGCNGGPATPIDVHTPRSPIVTSITTAFANAPEASGSRAR